MRRKSEWINVNKITSKVADLKAKAEEFNNSGKYEEAKAKIEEAKTRKMNWITI